MARFFEMTNANHRVVIDDEFPVAKFLYRSNVVGASSPISGSIKFEDTYGYEVRKVIDTRPTAASYGFEWTDNTEVGLRLLSSKLMCFARTDVTDNIIGARVYLELINNSVELVLHYRHSVANAMAEYCVYTTADMVPTKYGAQAFNENGKLVFDAMRGYLQVVKTIQGGVNVVNNPAATYLIDIPNGLDVRNLFISNRSINPFLRGLRISASGVYYNSVVYRPVQIIISPTQLQIQLIRVGTMPGNNSRYSFDGFFETVIYCPYPTDIWIDGL